MGGMSSLSFETTFPSEAENRSATAQYSQSAPGEKRPHASCSQRVPIAISTFRTAGEASPWVLSSLRRFLDIVAASGALFVFAPLLGMAAALVRVGSRGPVFFRQRRMGRNGEEFTLYKFRSMTPANGAGSCITVTGDARITPVGAFLRRYKIDELPQFWNVLKGDMSLVGPRPKLPHHEALHLACRPGITGVATLAFHREEEFLSAIPEQDLDAFYEVFVKPTKAQMDQEYMRRATFASDLAILWRTACSCVFGPEKTASGPVETIAKSASDWARRARASAPQPTTHRDRVTEPRIRPVTAAAEW
jgi:lipopolysaccharide/colanic/teichoic acid biosynthesis glycosyltransferase